MGNRLARFRLAPLLAALVAAPSGNAAECPPASIRIAPSYEAPHGFAYVPPEDIGIGRGAQDPLGSVEAAVGWEVDVGVRKRCVQAECRLCVYRIEGEAGFGRGRVRVSAALRDDRCRTEAVLAHETRHLEVFEESTRLGTRRLVDSMRRWAARQEAVVVSPEAVEAAAKARYAEVERMMEEGTEWIEERARALNERIDSPEGYAAERARIERRCGRQG